MSRKRGLEIEHSQKRSKKAHSHSLTTLGPHYGRTTLQMLTPHERSQFFSTSKAIRRDLGEETVCWHATQQGKQCVVNKPGGTLQIGRECFEFCTKHYWRIVRMLFHAFFENPWFVRKNNQWIQIDGVNQMDIYSYGDMPQIFLRLDAIISTIEDEDMIKWELTNIHENNDYNIDTVDEGLEIIFGVLPKAEKWGIRLHFRTWSDVKDAEVLFLYINNNFVPFESSGAITFYLIPF